MNEQTGFDLSKWGTGLILINKSKAGYSATAAVVLHDEDRKILEDLFARMREPDYYHEGY